MVTDLKPDGLDPPSGELGLVGVETWAIRQHYLCQQTLHAAFWYFFHHLRLFSLLCVSEYLGLLDRKSNWTKFLILNVIWCSDFGTLNSWNLCSLCLVPLQIVFIGLILTTQNKSRLINCMCTRNANYTLWTTILQIIVAKIKYFVKFTIEAILFFQL